MAGTRTSALARLWQDMIRRRDTIAIAKLHGPVHVPRAPKAKRRKRKIAQASRRRNRR